MVLRELSPSDALLLFRWRNDNRTIASSFDQSPVSWEMHVLWMLRQNTKRSWIAYVQDTPIGCVRITPDLDRGMEIHIVVAPGERGKGYGEQMLRAALDLLPREVDRVAGYIRLENAISRRVFEKAGFKESFVVAEWHRPHSPSGHLGDLELG